MSWLKFFLLATQTIFGWPVTVPFKFLECVNSLALKVREEDIRLANNCTIHRCKDGIDSRPCQNNIYYSRCKDESNWGWWIGPCLANLDPERPSSGARRTITTNFSTIVLQSVDSNYKVYNSSFVTKFLCKTKLQLKKTKMDEYNSYHKRVL